MFGDYSWIDKRYQIQYSNFSNWELDAFNAKNLLIIEIGAGKAVPTVRMLAERFYETYSNSTFVRINPFPGDAKINSKGKGECISLAMNGEDALREIDKIYQN